MKSLLILPQIISIFKRGYADGISYSLIILNLLGDALKTFYFFHNVHHK
ncbi:MAG: PQ-loop repeat-containing protein [Bdellovibrionales bacterium]|nr:PQ-loop repeat-containing protein [Bdellovibrionales bacterium]